MSWGFKVSRRVLTKNKKSGSKEAKSELIKAIAEAAWTVLSGEVQLTPTLKRCLFKDDAVIRQLASKQRSAVQKRKVISSQRGSNVIAFLFNLLKSIF